MITEVEAIALLREYIRDENRIAHSIGVAGFAFALADSIHRLHPELPVDPQKVKIAGILHDIGRALPGDHEVNSVNILLSKDLNEIAAIVVHGTMYETMLIRGIDDPSLLPQTIENKIVAYADARFKDRPMSMEKRWADIETRRASDKEKVRALHLAKERFFFLERELMGLISCRH